MAQLKAVAKLSSVVIAAGLLHEGHHRHMDEYQKRYDVMKCERIQKPLTGTLRERRLIRECEEQVAIETRYTNFDNKFKSLNLK